MNDTCATHRSRVQCRHSSFYSFRSSSVGLETGEWRRCRSLSFTPPASLRSHGSRPRPTRHSIVIINKGDLTLSNTEVDVEAAWEGNFACSAALEMLLE